MRVYVIGAGGIGSYFAAHIDKLLETNQLNSFEFTFYDDDVVEQKNILYQNFEMIDVNQYKTEALSLRFMNLNYKKKRVDHTELAKANLVILCADNNKIRRDAYKVWSENKIPFIDARSNGSACGIYSSETENYLSTIDSSDDSYSCQYKYQLDKKEVELGNVIISSILAQCVLNYARKNELPSDFMYRF